MDIPWGTDNELSEAQFYNRTNETEFLNKILKTTGNTSAPAIFLTGIRGVGKTALMKKVKRELEKDYLVVYVDISKSNAFQEKTFNRTTFMQLFYKKIIQACNDQNFLTFDKKLLKLLKTNKFTIDRFIKFGEIPIPHFKSEINYPNLAEYVVDLPQRIYEEYSPTIKGVIVMFDEFQYIREMDEDLNGFLWFLRSSIQDQKNVAYVLSGSMSLTDELIEQIAGKKGAFGGRMLTLEVQNFSYETTKKYLEDCADSLKFSDDGLKRFFKCTKGLPSYINNFANLLPTDALLDEKTLIKEFKKDLPLLSSHYINMWYNLTLQEQKIIVSLLEKPLIRQEIADNLEVTTGSISKPLNKLKRIMIIEQNQKEYRIYDEIFKLWLIQYKEKNEVYPFRVI